MLLPKCFIRQRRTVPERSEGFTLVELLITIGIIGLIFGIVVTATVAIKKNARDTQRQSDLKSIQTALEQYNADATYYPSATSSNPLNLATTTSITSGSGNPNAPGVVRTYLSKIPRDPVSGAYLYINVQNNAVLTCDNSTTTCTQYCIYANLENLPSGYSLPAQCPSQTGYNFAVTQP